MTLEISSVLYALFLSIPEPRLPTYRCLPLLTLSLLLGLLPITITLVSTFHHTPLPALALAFQIISRTPLSPPWCSGVTATQGPSHMPCMIKGKGNNQHTESCRLCRFPSNSVDVFFKSQCIVRGVFCGKT
ncbi:hypothetical protein L211DRAFT_398467 [Terfezia boudieri ATCC MYA-4762]|uniref:Uncharacterized protein n=1 Tax=Terfezia boudieri ATCC MYA-4762 TaxID=1051890 RepID=A0A3N4MJQ5_9PEZI|nr:hypothetical protein L211DRAFT_398467 [Terfezia boudieri ATCC MYA-4762]